MLTVDQARQIADQWRPQFADEASFEQSWVRLFDMVGDPTAEKAHNWLAKDCAKDQIKHAGIIHEPTLPTHQADAFTDAVLAAAEARPEPRRDCWKCGNFEDEPAAETCSNPRWHLPNWTHVDVGVDPIATLARAMSAQGASTAEIDEAQHGAFLKFWNTQLAARLKP